MRMVAVLLVLLGSPLASPAELPPFPPRDASFSSDAWGTYTRVVLGKGYPDHIDLIRNITVAIKADQTDQVRIGIDPRGEKPLLVMSRGFINAVRSPKEFLLVCGHELGHAVLKQIPRASIFEDLAFRGMDTRELLRITQQEMEADLFAALDVADMKVSESMCGLRDAHAYIFSLWPNDPEHAEWVTWHEWQRLDLIADWCRVAQKQESSPRIPLMPEHPRKEE